jgi:hypothetical protein
MEVNKLLGDHGNRCFLHCSGGATELAGLQGNVEGLVRLGYPPFFVSIIGFWKVLGAIAILVPGFRGLKNGPMPAFSLT